ncbi:MAG: alkaline phosphatase D family protein [Candidatus Obscuribacterales bacterium]|nr:alkaline phosphatase D family protein [Candidatus Obscuribacterales bacterium]
MLQRKQQSCWYACYKTDPDLQLNHARFPWIVTWDDHEVDNLSGTKRW